MTDPNYEHEFYPNRKGTCQRVVSGGHCGEREEFPAHVRWQERHPVEETPEEREQAVRDVIEALGERVERLEQRVETLEKR